MHSRIKYFLCIVSAAFILSGSIPFFSFADGSDTDSASGLSVSLSTPGGAFTAGDTVTTEVSLSNSPSMENLELHIDYDANKLTYMDTIWAKSLGSDEYASVHANNGSLVLSVESESGFSIGGNLATVTFTALANDTSAPATIYIQGITYDSDDDDEEEVKKEDSSSKKTSDTKSSDSKTSDKNKSSSGSKSNTTTTATKRSTSTTRTASSRTDKSYKTGVMLGNDLFLIIGAGAAIGALAFGLLGKQKRK